MKILCLMREAYGTSGGIGQYNRDFLAAASNDHNVSKLCVIVRHAGPVNGDVPRKVIFQTSGTGSKARFITGSLRFALEHRDARMIMCGHINFVPLAFFLSLILGIPWYLQIHGIEAWDPQSSWRVRMMRNAQLVVGVSTVTLDRFLSWCPDLRPRTFLLPPCFHGGQFKPGPRNADLARRYGLADEPVIMTLGRLVSKERYKGFDATMDAMPLILKERPNVQYLVCGRGPDEQRLRQKAQDMGIEANVKFAINISEEEKPEHYRLANVFALPSKGEGFGIVLLEAMATGLHTVASDLDGGREALREGLLGRLVNPENPQDVARAILAALNEPPSVPQGLDYFAFPAHSARVHDLLGRCA